MKHLHNLQSKLWIFALPIAIGLIWFVKENISEYGGWVVFFQALKKFSFVTWVLVLICTFTELYFQLLRSWVMLRVDIPDLKLTTVIKAGLAAFSAGSATPGRVGDGLLILLIPGATARAVGIALVDRMMFWPPMHVLGAIALGMYLLPKFGMLGVIISVAFAITYLVVLEWFVHITRSHHEPHTKKKFLQELYQGFTSLPKKVWRIGLLLGLVQYLVILIQFQIGLFAVNSNLTFVNSSVIFGSLQLLRSFVAFTPGNLGTSELIGMMLGKGQLGVCIGLQPDTLPQITIPFFLTNTVIPAIIGFPFWITMSRRLKKTHSNG